jgi:hypothetical protein
MKLKLATSLIVIGFALLCGSAAAQCTPGPNCSPNIGLNEPPYGTANWNTLFNENWSLLDQLLSGGAALTFASNPGNFGPAQNNLFMQFALGTATPSAVLTQLDATGTVICCLSDAVTGVATVPAGASNVQVNGGDFLIINNSTTVGGGVGGGAVGVYSVCLTFVSGPCWGGNDNATSTSGAPATKLYGREIDVNAFNTGDNVIGLVMNGNFRVQPTSAPTISIGNAGTGKWTDALRVNDGATSNNVAVNIGATGTGNGVNSQTIDLASRSSGGTTYVGNIQSFPGVPSGACPNTTLGINAAASTASTVLYVCPAGTSTWTAVTVP